jgi:hypothetical protein
MQQTSKTITLNLSVEETNLILEGLGNMPFAKVYALVGKIQEQASEQLKQGAEPAESTGSDAGDKPVRVA